MSASPINSTNQSGVDSSLEDGIGGGETVVVNHEPIPVNPSSNSTGLRAVVNYESYFVDFMNHSTPLDHNKLDDPKLIDCFWEYVHDMLGTGDVGHSECPVMFDGISCWPRTPSGSLITIPCFEEFNGLKYNSSYNATLECNDDGTWAEKSFYRNCVPIPPEVNSITTGKNIKLIYYIGNSMSVVAVLIALWIFLSFKDLRCLRNTIHINLLFSYLLHNVSWIASAALERYVGVFLSCFFFIAVNYSTLTNFFWMFVEGLYLYMLVVKTFSVENIKLRIYIFIGWGISVFIVIIWMSVRLQVTAASTFSGTDEGLDGACSLYVEDEFDWIVRVPVLMILTFNILFLVRIMWVLITKLRSANTVETQRYWKASKALLVLIPLLGLTYMLLLALPEQFEHFRVVLLSTQGFWVAIFYCFLNSEVRNSIRHHIERWQTERGIAHSRGSSARQLKDSSPRSRSTVGLSKYGRRWFGSKRESLVCSEMTTMTTYVTNGYTSQTTSTPIQSTANSQTAASSLQVFSTQLHSSSQLSLTTHPSPHTTSPMSASTALLATGDSQETALSDAVL